MKVVGTLTAACPLPEQIARAKSAGVDMIELRLDSFEKIYGPFQRVQEFGRNIIREIKTKARLPIILTLRSRDEAGKPPFRQILTDKKRAEILARLMPSVDMVDVEIRHAEFARQMTVIGHIHHVKVIHSAHDFSGPGKLSVLTNLSRRSIDFRGDIFKVAVTPSTNDDLEKFLWWGQSLKNKRKVLIGMGATGLMSRIVGASFGSELSYGHLGRSAAPGQLAAKDLVRSVQAAYARPA